MAKTKSSSVLLQISLRDHVSQFFRSFSGHHPIDVAMLERHLNTVENKLYNTDTTRDLALSPAPSDASLLTNTTTTTEDSYRPRVRHPSGDGATDSLARDKMDSGSPLAPTVPDHTVDNWTKMLFLTPLGRYQASVHQQPGVYVTVCRFSTGVHASTTHGTRRRSRRPFRRRLSGRTGTSFVASTSFRWTGPAPRSSSDTSRRVDTTPRWPRRCRRFSFHQHLRLAMLRHSARTCHEGRSASTFESSPHIPSGLSLR